MRLLALVLQLLALHALPSLRMARSSVVLVALGPVLVTVGLGSEAWMLSDPLVRAIALLFPSVAVASELLLVHDRAPCVLALQVVREGGNWRLLGNMQASVPIVALLVLQYDFCISILCAYDAATGTEGGRKHAEPCS